jgi:hypothetical protein
MLAGVVEVYQLPEIDEQFGVLRLVPKWAGSMREIEPTMAFL